MMTTDAATFLQAISPGETLKEGAEARVFTANRFLPFSFGYSGFALAHPWPYSRGLLQGIYVYMFYFFVCCFAGRGKSWLGFVFGLLKGI